MLRFIAEARFGLVLEQQARFNLIPAQLFCRFSSLQRTEKFFFPDLPFEYSLCKFLEEPHSLKNREDDADSS